MISWGLIGASSSLLGRYKVNTVPHDLGPVLGILIRMALEHMVLRGIRTPDDHTFIVTNINSFFWDLSYAS